MTTEIAAPTGDSPLETGLSPVERATRVFTAPARAWSGLEWQKQWWIALLVQIVLQVGLTLATYQRAMVPMMMDQWDQAVVNGQMPAEQADKLATFFQHDPRAMAIVVGQQVVAGAFFTLLIALVVWFGISFLLGAKFRYRLALEVVCWAALVQLPETIGTFTWAWAQETFKGIHFGLAVLLPEIEHPTKLHTGLAVLMDSIGPFRIWYLVVLILGCSALSGAPRRNVSWVMVGLYFTMTVFIAAIAAAFTPGS